MRAVRIFYDKQVLADGAIIEMVIWQLPRPLPGSRHRLKYRLFYGRPSRRLVGYDNEAGKGDHRHIGDVETAYRFTTPEQLVADFLADVRRARGKRR
ncbi:MAG: hypothetical protein AMXMBFR8_00490 [Nevskiales bacterium]